MQFGPGEFIPQITSHNTPTSKRNGMRLCECVMFSQNSCACNGNRMCPFQTAGCRRWQRGSASGMNRGEVRRPLHFLTPWTASYAHFLPSLRAKRPLFKQYRCGGRSKHFLLRRPLVPTSLAAALHLWPRACFQPTLLFWPAWWPALCSKLKSTRTSKLKEMTMFLVPPVLKPTFMAI